MARILMLLRDLFDLDCAPVEARRRLLEDQICQRNEIKSAPAATASKPTLVRTDV